jgi:hypothetical protein
VATGSGLPEKRVGPSSAPRTFTIDPRYTRGNWLAGCVSVVFAGFYAVLPFVPLDGRRSTVIALRVVCVFGFSLCAAVAWFAYRTVQRLPGSAIALDDDGVWRAHTAKDTALLRWGDIRGTRERRLLQRLELLGALGRTRLTIEYYLLEIEALRALLAEKAPLILEHRPLPARFTRSVAHHPFYIGSLVGFSLLGVYVGALGTPVLGYALMPLVVAGIFVEYLTTVWRCTVAPDKLEVDYPLRRRVLRRNDVATIGISNAFKDSWRQPQVDVVVAGSDEAHPTARTRSQRAGSLPAPQEVEGARPWLVSVAVRR